MKLLQVITNSSRTLQYFINDIIDLIKIKQGNFIKICERFQIEEAVTEIVDLFTLACSEKKIRLVSFINQRIPQFLKGDVKRLQ